MEDTIVSDDNGDVNDNQGGNLGNAPILNMNDLLLLETERGSQPGVYVLGVPAPGVPAPEEYVGNNYDGYNYYGDNKNDDNLSMDAMADTEEDRCPDTGAIEMENEDVYHPDT